MISDLIRQRKSVRTFDGKPLSAEDRSALEAYTASPTNPFSVPITFRLLDVKEYGLSSPVIVGADTYLAAKVERVPNFEIAYGFSFAIFYEAWIILLSISRKKKSDSSILAISRSSSLRLFSHFEVFSFSSISRSSLILLV